MGVENIQQFLKIFAFFFNINKLKHNIQGKLCIRALYLTTVTSSPVGLLWSWESNSYEKGEEGQGSSLKLRPETKPD